MLDVAPDHFISLIWHVFYHQCLFSRRGWNSQGYKISVEGQTCCSVLYYDNVTNLTFHTSEAWMELNSFQSLGWKDTVISQVNRAGWGHAQAIKKVTAHPVQWQATASHSQTRTHAEIQMYAHNQQPCDSQLLETSSESGLINIKALALCHLLSSLPHILIPETKVEQRWTKGNSPLTF